MIPPAVARAVPGLARSGVSGEGKFVAQSEGLTAAQALALLVPAVREAGDIGLRFLREGARRFVKHDSSPVTEADLAIDAHLAERLGKAAPGIGWLSEEA